MTSEPAAQESEQAEPELAPWLRRAIPIGMVVTTAASALGTAFLPYLLLEHPLLLLATSSDLRNIVLVAPQVDGPMIGLVAVPRRIAAMLCTYGMGVLYGRALLKLGARRLPRLGRLVAAFERVFVRFRRGSLLLWPSYAVSALAGITRTPLRTFVPWMAVGQVIFVVFTYYLGAAVSAWTDQLITWLRGNVWESTAVCVALVAVQQLVSFVRRRRAAGRLRAMPVGEPGA